MSFLPYRTSHDAPQNKPQWTPGTLTNGAQVDNRGSLENVSTKWLAEINEHCPGVKIVLCALKCDLREEHEKDEAEGQALIQYQEGLEAAKRIGALRYLGKFYCESSGCGVMLTRGRMFGDAQPRRQRGVH